MTLGKRHRGNGAGRRRVQAGQGVPGLSSTSRAASLAACLLVAACGTAPGQPPAVGGHDTPVPAGETREELGLVVDLENTSSCEEKFDLTLYENRAIDLVEWDDAEGCAGRVIVIRYLPSRAGRADVLKAVRDSSVRVQERKP